MWIAVRSVFLPIDAAMARSGQSPGPAVPAARLRPARKNWASSRLCSSAVAERTYKGALDIMPTWV